MPHLIVQYSANLESSLDLEDFGRKMHEAMLVSGTFPLAGIRVRAFAADHAIIADQHEKNAFIAMVLRMGAGRSLEEKRKAGDLVMEAAKAATEQLLSEPYFALSLEIVEIDPELSWKANSIHPRLKVDNS